MQVLQKMNVLHRQFSGRDLSRQLTSIDEGWKSQLMAADAGFSARGRLRPSLVQGEGQASVISTVPSELQLSTLTPAVTPENPASLCMEIPDIESHTACISTEPASGAPDAAANLSASPHEDPSSAVDFSKSVRVRISLGWV